MKSRRAKLRLLGAVARDQAQATVRRITDELAGLAQRAADDAQRLLANARRAAWCARQRAELARDQGVCDEDAARLSPLKAKKVNVLGRYAIVASQPAEGLRPLLDPANPGDKVMLD